MTKFLCVTNTGARLRNGPSTNNGNYTETQCIYIVYSLNISRHISNNFFSFLWRRNLERNIVELSLKGLLAELQSIYSSQIHAHEHIIIGTKPHKR